MSLSFDELLHDDDFMPPLESQDHNISFRDTHSPHVQVYQGQGTQVDKTQCKPRYKYKSPGLSVQIDPGLIAQPQDASADSELISPQESIAKSWQISEGGSDTVPASPSTELELKPKARPKKSHARKQPEGHIKRARNAFILFRKHVTDSGLIPPSVEVKHQNISVVAAKMWREAPQEVRQKFQEQARIEKEEHQRLYPGYRYQPVFRRTDIIRRRVRKDAAEDEKVEAVAEALIKGKAGDELEKEIKDQVQRASEVERPKSRRRRDQGQLSKGAIRAQRAQARAKQMRSDLLGTNLLNMSMYNAQQQQQLQEQQRAYESYPQYHHGYESYGYEYEAYAHEAYAQEAYAHEYAQHEYDMYRLAPIMPEPAYGEYLHEESLPALPALPESLPTLPPLGLDPEIPEWTRVAQTPSGHVEFNERLFDGLPTGLSERRDDGLGSFEEAVAQAAANAAEAGW